MEPKRGRYWLVRPHLWLAVITVALTAPGLVVGMLDGHYRDGGGRLTPELDWIIGSAALAVLGCLLAAVVVLIWKGRARMAGRSTRFKVVYGLVAMLSQLAVSFALAAVLFMSNFHLFEGHYLGVKARSPSGDRTAYLYSEGLFCGYQVFVRRGGAARITLLDSFTTDCDDRPARPQLHWSADGQAVEVTGPNGESIPHKSIQIFPVVH